MVSCFFCFSCFSWRISWTWASASASNFLLCSAHVSAFSSASFSLDCCCSIASLSCSTSLLPSMGARNTKLIFFSHHLLKRSFFCVKIYFESYLWPALADSADWCFPPSGVQPDRKAGWTSPDPGCRCWWEHLQRTWRSRTHLKLSSDRRKSLSNFLFEGKYISHELIWWWDSGEALLPFSAAVRHSRSSSCCLSRSLVWMESSSLCLKLLISLRCSFIMSDEGKKRQTACPQSGLWLWKKLTLISLNWVQQKLI